MKPPPPGQEKARPPIKEAEHAEVTTGTPPLQETMVGSAGTGGAGGRKGQGGSTADAIPTGITQPGFCLSAPPVGITDDALIRRIMPAEVIASLEADAARGLAARPDKAVVVVRHLIEPGRTWLVVLYAGYDTPTENGLVAITFLGAGPTEDARAKRTLLGLISGAEGRREARGGRS